MSLQSFSPAPEREGGLAHAFVAHSQELVWSLAAPDVSRNRQLLLRRAQRRMGLRRNRSPQTSSELTRLITIEPTTGAHAEVVARSI